MIDRISNAQCCRRMAYKVVTSAILTGIVALVINILGVTGHLSPRQIGIINLSLAGVTFLTATMLLAIHYQKFSYLLQKAPYARLVFKIAFIMTAYFAIPNGLGVADLIGRNALSWINLGCPMGVTAFLLYHNRRCCLPSPTYVAKRVFSQPPPPVDDGPPPDLTADFEALNKRHFDRAFKLPSSRGKAFEPPSDEDLMRTLQPDPTLPPLPVLPGGNEQVKSDPLNIGSLIHGICTTFRGSDFTCSFPLDPDVQVVS